MFEFACGIVALFVIGLLNAYWDNAEEKRRLKNNKETKGHIKDDPNTDDSLPW